MLSNTQLESPLLGRRQHRLCQRLPAGWGNQAKSWQRCLIPGRHTDTTAPLGREQPKKRSMCSYKAIEKDLPLLGRRQRRHSQRLPAGGGNQAKSRQRCLLPGRHTDTAAPLGREQPKKRSMCSYKAIEKDLPLLICFRVQCLTKNFWLFSRLAQLLMVEGYANSNWFIFFSLYLLKDMGQS